MVLKGDELVAIVDSFDNVCYVTERSIADRDGLRMRSARAIVFDPNMRMWVHRRALQKLVNGGVYDVGIGETPRVALVNGDYVHESYGHAIRRGISEEMFDGRVSIDDVVVTHFSRLPPMDIPGRPRNYDVSAFFYDQSRYGPITPEKEEIESGSFRFVTELELREMFGKEVFTGVAPVIAQIALYMLRHPKFIPINLLPGFPGQGPVGGGE